MHAADAAQALHQIGVTSDDRARRPLAHHRPGEGEEAVAAERVDGYNPLAVAEAVERKKGILLAGEGPVLLDVITYRLTGHSPSDASSYRTKEEIALWEEQDCVANFGRYLVDNGHARESDLAQWKGEVEERVRRALELAASPELSPRLRVDHRDRIGALMFSNRKIERCDDREPEVLLPLAENPRLVANRKKSRSGLDEQGRPLPKAKVLSFRDALFEALLHRFYQDPTMVAFGEENRDWGGAFAVYRGALVGHEVQPGQFFLPGRLANAVAATAKVSSVAATFRMVPPEQRQIVVRHAPGDAAAFEHRVRDSGRGAGDVGCGRRCRRFRGRRSVLDRELG